jgi:peptide/nickel transport system permease protein
MTQEPPAASPAPAVRTGRWRFWSAALGRIGHAIIVLWLAFTITFFLLYIIPGDAALARLGDEASATPEQLATLREAMGLNRPLYAQYFAQLFAAFTGDLGKSLRTGEPVVEAIAAALPQTLLVASLSLMLAITAGTLLAVGAAFTRRYWLRNLLLSVPSLCTSVPTFWTGLIMLMIFSYQLRWLPAFGSGTAASTVLPVVVLSIIPAAMITQVLAGSLIEAKHTAYARTAFNKGAGTMRVLIRHCMRNALIPTLTLIGVITGNLLSGSVIVETVFSRSGLGRVMLEAVQTVDLTVVQGVVFFCALVFVAVNLAVDLCYPLIDPRMRTRRALS